MEKNKNPFILDCNMAGMKPAMLPIPYPPVQVQSRNTDYADLVSVDYCGAVSELSAITQYINNENRLCTADCGMARTLLEIGMAEMMHLQKLGELIQLLGGEVCFTARQPGGSRVQWTPAFLSLPRNPKQMLCADIQAEKEAITQYKTHLNKIHDPFVDAVLRRIIQDEEYHILLLETMLEKC